MMAHNTHITSHSSATQVSTPQTQHTQPLPRSPRFTNNMAPSSRITVIILSLLASIRSLHGFTAPSIHTRSPSPLFQSAVDDPPLQKPCTLDGKKIRGPLTPLGNFVLVRTKDSLDATEGGILLPDQVRSHSP